MKLFLGGHVLKFLTLQSPKPRLSFNMLYIETPQLTHYEADESFFFRCCQIYGFSSVLDIVLIRTYSIWTASNTFLELLLMILCGRALSRTSWSFSRTPGVARGKCVRTDPIDGTIWWYWLMEKKSHLIYWTTIIVQHPFLSTKYAKDKKQFLVPMMKKSFILLFGSSIWHNHIFYFWS